GELGERGAVEIPGLAELVQQPDDLAWVANRVRRELRRDHRVDRSAVRLLEVEQPPEERLRQHALSRIPLVRHRHELRLVPVLAERLHEPVREDLRAAALERHLRHADGESHGRRRSSSSTRRARSSTRRSSASLTIRCSANAGSTYQRISLRKTRLPSNATQTLAP